MKIEKETEKMFTEKTLIEVFEFNAEMQKYNSKSDGKKKIDIALLRMSKRLNKAFDDYNNAVDDFNVQLDDVRSMNAAVDSDGILLRDDKGVLKFTPEGDVKCRKEIKKLKTEWDKKSEKMLDSKIKVQPFYLDEIDIEPLGLTAKQIDCFTGFIIKE